MPNDLNQPFMSSSNEMDLESELNKQLLLLKTQIQMIEDNISVGSDSNPSQTKRCISLIEKLLEKITPNLNLINNDQSMSRMKRQKVKALFLKEVNHFKSLVKTISSLEEGAIKATGNINEENTLQSDYNNEQNERVNEMKMVKKMDNIREESEKIKKIKENALHLQSMMTQMNDMVYSQGEMVDTIEVEVQSMDNNIMDADAEIDKISDNRWQRMKSNICCCSIFFIICIVLAIFIIIKVVRKK
eukprot:GAHX01000013.1.p1 GENE.GAHX01000013.1~~GAHX01000013.1.p1  ORF type:complete len:263 (+),score=68.97 GAHX01000013.1:56-790(+)